MKSFIKKSFLILAAILFCQNSVFGTEPGNQEGMQYKPGVVWKPDYSISEKNLPVSETGLPAIIVGADLKSKGKIPLTDAIKRLADLKGMTVSWDSEIDQTAAVDVNINANDDYWRSLENLLRQMDYYFEVQDKTIIIKYLVTRNYYLNIPMLEGFYITKVGGNFLGTKTISENIVGGGGDEMNDDKLQGKVYSRNYNPKIDIWKNIEENLQKILSLSSLMEKSIVTDTEKSPQEIEAEKACAKYKANSERYLKCKKDLTQEAQPAAQSAAPVPAAAGDTAKKGDRAGFYYTIDKPIGIITITAPNSIQKKIESYVNRLKEESSKQVIIEAKILEIQLSEDNQKGVNWQELLGNVETGFQTSLGFGRDTVRQYRLEDNSLYPYGAPNVSQGTFTYTLIDPNLIYPTEGGKLLSTIGLADRVFNIFIGALNQYGNVKVLSSPKLTLTNGQNAVLTAGRSEAYIKSVESEIDTETGVITYTIVPDSVLDGLGFGVMASIDKNNDVVLQMTPVISDVQEIRREEVGFLASGQGAIVGLPIIDLREMSTTARVKNGQLLVMGGLVSDITRNEGNKVPILGDVPLLGQVFRYSRERQTKTELIILLKPEVITL